EIWSRLLNISGDKLSTSANFFESGGHSLLSVSLVGEVRSEFAIELLIRDIFDAPQLSQLAGVINNKLDQDDSQFTRPQLRAIERISNLLPASFAQQRLWFIDQMDGGSSHYNMPGALRFKGDLDATAIELAFTRIIERHEPLRTVFVNGDDGVQQHIKQQVEFKLTTIDLTSLEDAAQQAEVLKLAGDDARQVFDLSQDLMLRATFIRLSIQAGALLFNIHHIASDGWSLGVLSDELGRQYDAIQTGKANPFAPLEIQYADYAQWQQNWLRGEVLDRQIGFWQTRLADAPQVHSLPLDRPRHANGAQAGGHHHCRLDARLSDQLNMLSLDCDATLFMTLQAAFALHLGRWSRETDIVMGTPIAGRGHKALAPLIGLFLNNQVLRSQFNDNPSFVELLKSTREQHISAHEYNELPFEVLVDKLNPVRSLSHAPIFQVLINMNNIEKALSGPAVSGPAVSASLAGVEISPLLDEVAVENKYDITLYIAQAQGTIGFDWVYNALLFDEATIMMVANEFTFLPQSIINKPEVSVLNHSWSSANVWQQPLPVKAPLPVKQLQSVQSTIIELFEQQVTRAPQQIALIDDALQMNYQVLNQKANQLARFLNAQYGIKLGSRVAIASE
ncbi:MAG: condensation domain-containing protein, partial [Psychrosphaera sp.]|nr:condensation domain-containing protein [Psychrosphaera sp.]